MRQRQGCCASREGCSGSYSLTMDRNQQQTPVIGVKETGGELNEASDQVQEVLDTGRCRSNMSENQSPRQVIHVQKEASARPRKPIDRPHRTYLRF